MAWVLVRTVRSKFGQRYAPRQKKDLKIFSNPKDHCKDPKDANHPKILLVKFSHRFHDKVRLRASSGCFYLLWVHQLIRARCTVSYIACKGITEHLAPKREKKTETREPNCALLVYTLLSKTKSGTSCNGKHPSYPRSNGVAAKRSTPPIEVVCFPHAVRRT